VLIAVAYGNEISAVNLKKRVPAVARVFSVVGVVKIPQFKPVNSDVRRVDDNESVSISANASGRRSPNLR
jgi:hypothetical protein